MAAFKLFARTEAPAGESSGAGGSGRPTPRPGRREAMKPFIVGGNLTKEGTPVKESSEEDEAIPTPTDAMSPLAALRNSLSGIARIEGLSDVKIKEIIVSRAIARAEADSKAADKSAARTRGKAAGEAEFETLMSVSLPALRESLIYWTGASEVGEKVTLGTALEAIQSIEDGTKAKQDFAFNYTKALYRDRIPKEKQALPPGRVAQRLLNNKDLKERFDTLWNKISNYDAEQIATRETASDQSELDALFARAMELDLSELAPAGTSKDVNEVASLTKIVNQAKNRGNSLQATLEEVLREIKLNDPTTNKPTSALQLLHQQRTEYAGDNSFIRYPSTDVTTKQQLAERYFNTPRRDGTFVFDRANGRPREGAPNEREYNSIGRPLSKILYRLNKNAEAVRDREGEIESEPVALVWSAVKDELTTELTETLATAINRPLEPEEVEKYVDPIILKLGEENVLNDIYDEAMVAYRKDLPTYKENEKRIREEGADEGEIWKTPDEFALLQRHFTAVLADRLALSEVITELSSGELKDLKLEFGGVERDPEIEAWLRSEDVDRDIGTKRMKVEVFIQELGKLGTISKQFSPDATDAEREQMSLIAKAIFHYANEKRLERWDPTNNKADETGKTLQNYASVFRTLVNRGLIEPLAAAHEAPPQREGETDEAYTLRLRKYFIYQDGLRNKAHYEFLKQQRAVIAADLRSLMTSLQGESRLDNFLGTLGRIFNKSGNALKDDINDMIDKIKADPESFTDKPPVERLATSEPYQIYIDGKLMQPKPETITTLEALHTKIEAISIAFYKLEESFKILVHRASQEAAQPSEALRVAVMNWLNDYRSQIIEPLETLSKEEKLNAILSSQDENLKRSAAYVVTAYHDLISGNRRILKQYETDLSEKLPQGSENTDELKTHLSHAEEENQRLLSLLKIVEEQRDERIKDVIGLQHEMNDLRESSLQGSRTTANALRRHTEENNALQTERNRLETEVTNLRQAVERQSKTIEELQARFEREHADNTKLNEMLATRDAEIVSLGHEIAALSTESGERVVSQDVESLQRELSETQTARESAERSLAALRERGEGDDTVERITELEFKVDTLLEYNESLVTALQMIASRIRTVPELAEVGVVIDDILADYEEGSNEVKANKQ